MEKPERRLAWLAGVVLLAACNNPAAPTPPAANEDPPPTLNEPGFSWTATAYTFADDGPQAQSAPPNGLKGEYWDNSDFTGKKLERTAAPLNFNWGSGEPASGFGGDTFSARWTGQVEARYSEEYTFYTVSDDGVRLWVNGQKLVDNWGLHGATENSGKTRLEAGKRYDLKMEFFENKGKAVAKLRWSSASQAKGIIPASQLFSPDAPSPGPVGASQTVKVEVPTGMGDSPLNVSRSLKVPQGAGISVVARIWKARFMAVAPNGDLLVSQPAGGSIQRVRFDSGGNGSVNTFAGGLKKPHDMVFRTINGTTYLYVSESNRITRSVYQSGDTTRRGSETVISGLPDGNSSSALGGAYGHDLKNIAISDNGKLYVSVASSSNADPKDLSFNPKQGAIYQYNLDGSGRRLFAQGIRNAEGLAFAPGTNDLWVVVNNRDNIAYPFQKDFGGDGSNDYGKVMQSYVDNHPPEEFTRVRDGGNYGWPFCNPNPDSGLDNMPFDRDVQNNADGSKLDCSKADRISKGIQAHSAPLGVSFWTDGPPSYRSGAVAAYHGCWNCSKLVGYKVAFFPWSGGSPGKETDLVTGWATNPSAKESWGRPVDVVPAPGGDLYISDDEAGAIYRLRMP